MSNECHRKNGGGSNQPMEAFMESLKQVLMRRDELTADEADALIEEAKLEVAAGRDPEEVLYEDFGLEPDYVFDLLS